MHIVQMGVSVKNTRFLFCFVFRKRLQCLNKAFKIRHKRNVPSVNLFCVPNLYECSSFVEINTIGQQYRCSVIASALYTPNSTVTTSVSRPFEIILFYLYVFYFVTFFLSFFARNCV